MHDSSVSDYDPSIKLIETSQRRRRRSPRGKRSPRQRRPCKSVWRDFMKSKGYFTKNDANIKYIPKKGSAEYAALIKEYETYKQTHR